MEVIHPDLSKPTQVVGVLARMFRARSVVYDAGPPELKIIFSPFNADVSIDVVPAAAEAVTVGDELITIETDDGVSTLATIAALVAGVPEAAGRLAVSGDAGTFPLGFAVTGLKLYDQRTVPPGAMFYMDKGGAWVPYKGFEGDVTVAVDVDAFKSPPDSILSAGSTDGTITGTRKVFRILGDGTAMETLVLPIGGNPHTQVAGVLAVIPATKSTLYDAGKYLNFHPKVFGVHVDVVPGGGLNVGVVGKVITLTVELGVDTYAAIAAAWAANADAVALSGLTGNAGTIPIGYAGASLDLWDEGTIAGSGMFALETTSGKVVVLAADATTGALKVLDNNSASILAALDVALSTRAAESTAASVLARLDVATSTRASQATAADILADTADIEIATELVAAEVVVGDGQRVRQETAAKLNMTEASAAGILTRANLLAEQATLASILAALDVATSTRASQVTAAAVQNVLEGQIGFASNRKFVGIDVGVYTAPDAGATTLSFTGVNLTGKIGRFWNVTDQTIHRVTSIVDPVPPAAGTLTFTPAITTASAVLRLPIADPPLGYSQPTDAMRTEPVTASPPAVNGPTPLLATASITDAAATDIDLPAYVANYDLFTIWIFWQTLGEADDTYIWDILARIDDNAAPGDLVSIAAWCNVAGTALAAGVSAGLTAVRVSTRTKLREVVVRRRKTQVGALDAAAIRVWIMLGR